MARDHARLHITIWQDDDFLALSGAAQRMFMMMLTQPAMTNCGVTQLTDRRWARSASDATIDAVQDALKELEAARFVLVDWDTDEVLVRSFTRRDGLLKEPNQVRKLVSDFGTIMSPAIRDAWLWEWHHRCRGLLDTSKKHPWDELETLPGSPPRDPWDPSGMPSENPSRPVDMLPGSVDMSPHPVDKNPSPKGCANPSAKGSLHARARAAPAPAPAPAPSSSPLNAQDEDDRAKRRRAILVSRYGEGQVADAIAEARDVWAADNPVAYAQKILADRQPQSPASPREQIASARKFGMNKAAFELARDDVAEWAESLWPDNPGAVTAALEAFDEAKPRPHLRAVP